MAAHDARRLAFAILSYVLLATIGRSADADPIEAALSKPANLDVVGRPLPELLASLSRRHEIPIVADRRVLEGAGVRIGDIAVTAQLKEQPLGDALDDVLRPHKLA